MTFDLTLRQHNDRMNLQQGKRSVAGFGRPYVLALVACAVLRGRFGIRIRPSGRAYGRAQWEAARLAGSKAPVVQPVVARPPVWTRVSELNYKPWRPVMRGPKTHTQIKRRNLQAAVGEASVMAPIGGAS